MSNIKTSYIRIYRKDRCHLNRNEIEKIFKLAVTAYGDFGSYWVRILKIYREAEKCLDIQFGSSKRSHSENSLEEYDIFNNYYVWERLSDDGGADDTIFTLQEDSHNKLIERTDPVSCLYRFNKIKIICNQLPSYFEQFNPESISSTEYEINTKGSYYACNSRSFMDVHEESKFYGPCLNYDPYYVSDYFVPTNDGLVTGSDHDLICNTFIYPHKQISENMRLELYWNNRVVQIIENRNKEILSYSADYWDNCYNKDFLDFKEKIKSS